MNGLEMYFTTKFLHNRAVIWVSEDNCFASDEISKPETCNPKAPIQMKMKIYLFSLGWILTCIAARRLQLLLSKDRKKLKLLDWDGTFPYYIVTVLAGRVIPALIPDLKGAHISMPH